MKSTVFEKGSRHSVLVFVAAALVVAVPLFFFLRSADASGVFGAATNYNVGNNPRAVALGDFNTDGTIDMAVANQSDNTISILFGNGFGGFTVPLLPIPATIMVPGTSPAAILAADFGNGHIDLAIASVTTNTISIFLGDGTGRFAPPSMAPLSYAVGSSPIGIAAGNWNGDSALDLAIANQADGTVTILKGSTTNPGDFSGGTASIPVGGAPAGIVAKDFTGDGFMDIAVTNMSGSTVIPLINNGAGLFSIGVATVVATNSSGLATADFNGDGFADLATVSEIANVVSILLGDGAGNFAPPTGGIPATVAVGNGPRSLIIGDFGNGQSDIATANSIDDTVSILLGQGNGSFIPALPPSMPVGAFPQAIVTGDFDADGSLDLATANFHSKNVSVLLDTPSVVNVTSSTPDGTYGAGAVISIQVSFNRPVAVDTTGGVPVLRLQNGTSNAAVYTSGSGTSTLTFTYTVGFPDSSLDLDYLGASAIALMGGTIQDAGLNNASLTLFPPHSAGSLGFNKALVINTAPATPILTETIPVPTPDTNHNPSYTFTSDTAGILSVSAGPCGTLSVSVSVGTNTITFIDPTTFGALGDATYSGCVLSLDDGMGHIGTLNVSPFTIYTDTSTTGGGTTGGGGGSIGSGGGHVHPVIKPYLNEYTAVHTPTTNHNPTYEFTSTESGTLSFGGGCDSDAHFVVVGLNTIEFKGLLDGTYTICSVIVTDLAGRASDPLIATPFTIYSVVPVQAEVPVIPASGSSTPAPTKPASQPKSPAIPKPNPDGRPVIIENPVPEPFVPDPVPAPAPEPVIDTTPAQTPAPALPVVTPPATPTIVPGPQTPFVQDQISTPASSALPPGSTNSVDIAPSAACSTGTSTSFIGTVGDVIKWAGCSVVEGIKNIF